MKHNSMHIDDFRQRTSVEKMRNFITTNNADNTVKCEKCDGLGLKGMLNKSDLTIWNGEYCDHCGGVGYLKKEIEEEKPGLLKRFILYFKW